MPHGGEVRTSGYGPPPPLEWPWAHMPCPQRVGHAQGRERSSKPRGPITKGHGEDLGAGRSLIPNHDPAVLQTLAWH